MRGIRVIASRERMCPSRAAIVTVRSGYLRRKLSSKQGELRVTPSGIVVTKAESVHPRLNPSAATPLFTPAPRSKGRGLLFFITNIITNT